MRAPWKKVRAVTPGAVAAVTRLRLARWRDVPRFLILSMRLRKRMISAEGAIAVSLGAAMHKREFWTLTAWRSLDDMRGYMRAPDHAAAMKTYRGRMVTAASAHWELDGHLPDWHDARSKLNEAATR